eukprot:Rhum_TRINITY_DN11169_c0_g1::Rhum_TRINITY_DN11169_c0_g1_i2::g.42907::m.42907
MFCFYSVTHNLLFSSSLPSSSVCCFPPPSLKLQQVLVRDRFERDSPQRGVRGLLDRPEHQPLPPRVLVQHRAPVRHVHQLLRRRVGTHDEPRQHHRDPLQTELLPHQLLRLRKRHVRLLRRVVHGEELHAPLPLVVAVVLHAGPDELSLDRYVVEPRLPHEPLQLHRVRRLVVVRLVRHHPVARRHGELAVQHEHRERLPVELLRRVQLDALKLPQHALQVLHPLLVRARHARREALHAVCGHLGRRLHRQAQHVGHVVADGGRGADVGGEDVHAEEDALRHRAADLLRLDQEALRLQDRVLRTPLQQRLRHHRVHLHVHGAVAAGVLVPRLAHDDAPALDARDLEAVRVRVLLHGVDGHHRPELAATLPLVQRGGRGRGRARGGCGCDSGGSRSSRRCGGSGERVSRRLGARDSSRHCVSVLAGSLFACLCKGRGGSTGEGPQLRNAKPMKYRYCSF